MVTELVILRSSARLSTRLEIGRLWHRGATAAHLQHAETIGGMRSQSAQRDVHLSGNQERP